MTTEQWQQIESLFEAALEEPTEARARYLAEACDDPHVRREVAQMLAASDKARTFLDAPAQLFAADLVAAEEGRLAVEQVGPYRLVQELGRGGMGAVFLAERADGQFEQQVALKVLGRRFPSEHLRQRFLAERQILASLSHPGIARLLDGGVTEDGAPYFVMEYVEGYPIDQYCREEQVPLHRRLALFLHACEAVAYAHRNLIVHRDLKPSNILVTADGTVKLLDFGIAKLIAPGEGAVPLTVTGLHLMTPEYASPEQVRGEPITTASDVYQLGILLHELLTGHRLNDFSTCSLTEMTHRVGEEEPPRPSMSVGGKPLFGTSPDRLRKLLRGDLDAIVLKALRKEPEARYDSVDHLADDVRRYLQGRPVAAHDGSTGYRVRTYVRRHRWGVAMTLVFVLLLVGYAVTMTAQQARTARERDRAEEYAGFLTDLFASPDPMAPAEAAGHRDITVREFLNQGANRVRDELANDPVMQTDLLYTIAQVNERLGYGEKARDLYEDVLTRRRHLYDEASPEVIEVMRHLAWVTDDVATADSLYERQLDLARRMEGGTGPVTARTLATYGNFLQNNGHLQEAERVLDEALAAKRAAGPEYDKDLIGVLLFAGQVKRALNQLSTADSLLHEAYEIRSAISGNDHPRTAIIMAEMAMIAEDQGDLDRAEQWKRRALTIFEEKLGPEHPYTVNMMNNLAVLLGMREAYSEEETLIRRVLDIRQLQYGQNHRETVSTLQNLAANLLRQGRLDEAEPLFEEVRRRYEKSLPAEHYLHAFPLLSLTDLYVRRRVFVPAEASARAAADHLRATMPEGHPLIAVAESRLGEALAGQQRFREAEPLLLRAYERLQEAEGFASYRENACRRVVDLYDAWGRPDDASPYRCPAHSY